MFRWFKNISLIILIILLVIFSIFNRNNVILNLYPLGGEVKIRLFILILLTLFIGINIGILISYIKKIKNLIHRKKEEKEIKDEDE